MMCGGRLAAAGRSDHPFCRLIASSREMRQMSGMRYFTAIALAAILICVPAAAGSEPSEENDDSASFIYEVTSWGRIIYHFQLSPDGHLQAWEKSVGDEEESGRGRTVYDFELSPDGHLQAWEQKDRKDRHEHRFNVRDEMRDPILYEKILEAIKPLQGPVKVDCKLAPTDMPASIYRWKRGDINHRFDFYHGCRSKAVRAVNDALYPLLDAAP